ncbi:MAG: SCO family protein [Planctomycetaceae bacterium]|nr:SCO family protein [Planctomycetaceae bacterium]
MNQTSSLLLIAALFIGATFSDLGVAYSADPTQQYLTPGLKDPGVEEHLEHQLPLDLNFRNDRNQIIRLGDIFHDDKPVIVSMNYSNCPMLCVLQLHGLVDSLREIDLVAGQDFRIISVSLEPNEKVEQLKKTKQKYVKSYGKTVDKDGWNFLSGTPAAVSTLAQTLGIRYVYLPKKKEFSHPAVFCICMPDGKISRYHYGIEFPPKTLRLSLVEASQGKIGTAFDRFILLCFHYDASEGVYAPTAIIIMKIAGAFTILGLGLLIWYSHRVGQKRQRLAEGSTIALAGSS